MSFMSPRFVPQHRYAQQRGRVVGRPSPNKNSRGLGKRLARVYRPPPFGYVRLQMPPGGRSPSRAPPASYPQFPSARGPRPRASSRPSAAWHLDLTTCEGLSVQFHRLEVRPPRDCALAPMPGLPASYSSRPCACVHVSMCWPRQRPVRTSRLSRRPRPPRHLRYATGVTVKWTLTTA